MKYSLSTISGDHPFIRQILTLSVDKYSGIEETILSCINYFKLLYISSNSKILNEKLTSDLLILYLYFPPNSFSLVAIIKDYFKDRILLSSWKRYLKSEKIYFSPLLSIINCLLYTKGIYITKRTRNIEKAIAISFSTDYFNYKDIKGNFKQSLKLNTIQRRIFEYLVRKTRNRVIDNKIENIDYLDIYQNTTKIIDSLIDIDNE